MPSSPTPKTPGEKKLRSRWARENGAEADGQMPPAHAASAAPTAPTPTSSAPPTVTPPALARRTAPIPRHSKARRGPKLIRGRITRSISIPLETEMRIRAFLKRTNVNFSAWMVRLAELDLDARGFPVVSIGEEPL